MLRLMLRFVTHFYFNDPTVVYHINDCQTESPVVILSGEAGPSRPVAALALGGAGCVYNSRRRPIAVPSASHGARNSSARNKDAPAAWPARAAPKTSPPS